jgi:hypothetical protein
MDRVSVLVNESQQRQLGRLSDYLFTVAQEDARKRKEYEMTHGQLRAQVDQLEAQLRQLTLAQAKGQ